LPISIKIIDNIDNNERKPAMEKTIEEDEIRGLEEEIDTAVDRLFVEKRRGLEESLLTEAPDLRPSHERVRDFSVKSPSPSSPAPLPFQKSVEKMEAQLLSLEWEVSKENIARTTGEVLALQRISKEEQEVTTVLNLMNKVLNYMIKNEENIHPPLIKFLLDSKETIKLLMKKEADSELSIYQQLAYAGIGARFACLEGLKDSRPAPSSLSLGTGTDREEILTTGEKRMGLLLNKMKLFSEKMEELFPKMDRYLSLLSQGAERPSEGFAESEVRWVNITVFKVDEKLFGVESEKVIKLFKVPDSLYDKFANQQKIRLKDFEVRLVNLNTILSVPGGDRKKEFKILAVKDNGEYKGLMVDNVVKRFSAHPDIRGGYGEYFSGMVHSTYQEEPVEIPILDVKKF
jgi:hypothetical protein